MVDRQNVVTTETAAPKKKAPAKKPAAKKTIEEQAPQIENTGERVLIYFESGAAYITGSGFRFSRSEPMGEVSFEEANTLLRLPNFRLPSDEEKEMYYNN